MMTLNMRGLHTRVCADTLLSVHIALFSRLWKLALFIWRALAVHGSIGLWDLPLLLYSKPVPDAVPVTTTAKSSQELALIIGSVELKTGQY